MSKKNKGLKLRQRMANGTKYSNLHIQFAACGYAGAARALALRLRKAEADIYNLERSLENESEDKKYWRGEAYDQRQEAELYRYRLSNETSRY